MEELRSRLGYLRGLADGLNVGESTAEGKVIRQIIAVLDDMIGSLEALKEDYEELFSYVESIDEDLTELEDSFMQDDDEEDDEDDEDDDNYYEEDDYEPDQGEEDICFTVECPECRYEVTIDEDILEDEESLEVLCPKCGRVVFVNDEEWEDELSEALDDDEDEEEDEEEEKKK